MEKSWIWADEASGGTMGATADLDDRTIMWFDQPGCACGGADSKQSIDDYLKNGARYITPPADVAEEMREVFSKVLSG